MLSWTVVVHLHPLSGSQTLSHLEARRPQRNNLYFSALPNCISLVFSNISLLLSLTNYHLIMKGKQLYKIQQKKMIISFQLFFSHRKSLTSVFLCMQAVYACLQLRVQFSQKYSLPHFCVLQSPALYSKLFIHPSANSRGEGGACQPKVQSPLLEPQCRQNR